MNDDRYPPMTEDQPLDRIPRRSPMTTPTTTTPAQVEAVARALAERHLVRTLEAAEWHADRPTYLREVWVREARIAVEVMSALGWRPPATPRAADRGFGRTLGTDQ